MPKKMIKTVGQIPWGTEIELLSEEGESIAKGTLDQERYSEYGPDTFGPVVRFEDGSSLPLHLSDLVQTSAEAVQRAERKWELDMAKLKADHGLTPYSDYYRQLAEYEADYEETVN